MKGKSKNITEFITGLCYDQHGIPPKGGGFTKRFLRRVLVLALVLVFVVSAGLFLRQLMNYRAAEEAYDLAETLSMTEADPAPTPTQAAQQPSAPVSQSPQADPTPQVTPVPTAQQPDPTPTPPPTIESMLARNLDALRAYNSEVTGWICIPGTAVSYPLMQAADNEKYLNTAWTGAKSTVGAIFLERRSSPDLSDFHTLIYGHYMTNGTMFACLLDFQTQSYYENHREIWVATDDGVYVYQIFASYEAPIDSDTYRLLFDSDEQKQSVLDYYMDSSAIQTGVVPAIEDQILTLSTCTGRGTYSTRWVVQAVLSEIVPRQ